MGKSAPRWDGDLADDCVLRDGRYGAHVEKMDRASWWCSAWGPGLNFNASDETAAPGHCIRFTSGESARMFCEWLIRAHKAGEYVAKRTR